jgi:hypothetical protein
VATTKRFCGVTVDDGDETTLLTGAYKRVLLTNEGSATVYVTNTPGEAATHGFPVRQYETIEDSAGHGLYGITASGSSDIRYVVE